MADSKKVSFDFAVITKVLVGLLLVFMGIAGFIDTRGTSFTRPLYNFLDEDAFIYIVAAVTALAGLGIIIAQFLPGLPTYIGTISGIVAVVLWILIIIFRDITKLDDKDFVDFIQDLAIDLIILIAIAQATVLSKKK